MNIILVLGKHHGDLKLSETFSKLSQKEKTHIVY